VSDIEHRKTADSVTSLSLLLNVRKKDEQKEEAWRTNNEMAWKHIIGAAPTDAPPEDAVVSVQDVVLHEGANIVADMHDLQHS